MTQSQKILAASLAAFIALPAFAFAQTGNGQDQPAQTIERGGRGDVQKVARGNRGEMYGSRRSGSLWKIAERLSAAETALAITPEQQDAWRAFTAAAIAFAETGHPGPLRGERGRQSEASSMALQNATSESTDAATAAENGSRTLTDLRALRRLDRMVEISEARAEAGRNLRRTVDGLSAVLTPEQVQTASRLLADGHHSRGPRSGREHSRR